MSHKVCILANEDSQSHLLWEQSVMNNEEISTYSILDLTSDNWLENLSKEQFDIFLLKPPGKTEQFKRLYDERVILLQRYFDTPIYPSLTEVLIYENKRFLRDWLTINELPHPKTFVFYNKREAQAFIAEQSHFPLVGKTNIGASGNGVVILKTKEQANAYLHTAFSKGIKPKSGPKLKKGSIFKKVTKVLKTKGFLKQRLKDYQPDLLNIQYHYVIFQEFVKHEWEWRCVRIGDSFFAHKKLVKGTMASGTLEKGYDTVPAKLLSFIKAVTDKHHLTSVAIDVFEKENGYLINEIQCFFGQSDPYQMLVNGKPGRYIWNDNSWLFEEGMFNTNECYDLRLEHALSTIKK
ncbi:MAG: ATP-grasp domain-containing protein [Bacteroidota bacterium]